MAQLLDGKALSFKIKEEIKEEVKILEQKTGKKPGLAVVIVGQDPASQVYVRNKAKDCDETNIYSEVHALPEETTQEELLDLIKKLNASEKIHGIIVQLPLPKHLDPDIIINNIDVNKDVDAFHPFNVGKVLIGDYVFAPCTPAGIVELIERNGIEIAGKNCVIVGRSNIVGKPMALMLMQKNGTPTVCHHFTKDLSAVCRNADILVAATGKPKMFKSDMVKEGAIVIDVGMDRDENGKLCGDVDFEDVKDKVSYITPVPGGVGPMTRIMLLKNTLTAFKKQMKI